MAIDAKAVVALVALLTRRLVRDNPQVLEIRRAEGEIMGVWALVRLAGVVVAAAVWIEVVLIARLELLEALDFSAVVFEDLVDTLAVLVALDGVDGLRRWAAEISERLVLVL